MKIEGSQLESEGILEVAQLMAIAARTAPKAKGRDNLFTFLLLREGFAPLIAEMESWGKKHEAHGFLRDAETIKSVPALFFIGTKIDRIGLKGCGFCGYENCDENKAHNGICAFNTHDLGIAVGSAVSVAADHRVDNRILFSAGKAALNLGLFNEEVKIAFAIPLSVSAKNPFFDRNIQKKQ
jgi:uncharacterized ferredoxin-like protein